MRVDPKVHMLKRLVLAGKPLMVQTHCGLVRDKYEISYVEKWEQFYKIAERSSAPCERCMKRAGK